MSAPMHEALAFSSIAAAALAAVTGSLHCVAMCGPLRIIAGDGWPGRISYQAGRGLAYLLLGATAGALGLALPTWALALLVFGGLLLGFSGGKLPASWQKRRGSLLAAASASPFLLGFSSGLLPCGMLHAWVAAAAATASPLWGALLLGVLWLGALPALELGSWFLAKPIASARKKFPRLVPLSFVLIALIPLLLRFPHGGPNDAGAPGASPSCHDSAGHP